MKKILSVFILIVFLSISIQAAGIKVLSPKESDKWLMGGGKDITWATLSGVTEKVKIRLFIQAGNKVLNIENSIDNSGKYKWTIPMSLNAGKYYLRVKTVDDRYWGDSEIFSIDKLQTASINMNVEKVLIPEKPPLDLKKKYLPDFHIYEMKVSADNKLLILYENLGATYSGMMEMKYKIKGNENVILSNVVILKGKRQIFKTGRTLTVNDLMMNGRSVGVLSTVDPNKNIDEEDDTNNVMFKSVYPEFDIPDYKPTDMEFVVKRRSDQRRALPFGYFRVKIKNLGSSYNGLISAQIYYRWEDESNYGRNFAPQTFEINLDKNQEKWLTLMDMWWPPKGTKEKVNVSFLIRIRPGTGNPERVLNNNAISRMLHPNGPF